MCVALSTDSIRSPADMIRMLEEVGLDETTAECQFLIHTLENMISFIVLPLAGLAQKTATNYKNLAYRMSTLHACLMKEVPNNKRATATLKSLKTRAGVTNQLLTRILSTANASIAAFASTSSGPSSGTGAGAGDGAGGGSGAASDPSHNKTSSRQRRRRGAKAK
jgi:hypothetical protein